MSKQLKLNFGSKQIGKLPTNLYTDRERIILNLWQNLLVQGKAYEKNQDGQYRTKPFGEGEVHDLVKRINVEGIASATFVPEKYEREKELKTYDNGTKGWKYTGKEVKIPNQINVIFKNGSTFTFLPEKLPELAYQIGGKEVFAKPQTNGLSPSNRDLFKFLKPFLSKDELRPAINGAYFDKSNNAVAATDGYRMAVIYRDQEAPVTQTGIYTEDGQVIDGNFPDYESAIRKKSTKSLTVDPKLFLETINQVLPFANKTTKQIALVRVDENGLKVKAEDLDSQNETSQYILAKFAGEPFESIGFNGKFLAESLKQIITYQKEKKEPITIEFDRPNRAAQIYFSSVFGSTLVLIMPAMLENYEETEEYKGEKVEAKQPTVSKALTLKVAIAKAKIAIALAVK